MRHEPAREGSAAAMAAITGTETRGAVEPRDIALEAVGCAVFDRFTIERDPPLNVQLECAAFLREDRPSVGHEAAIFPSIQRRAGTALIVPCDITVERGNRTLVRQVDAAGATALRDRTTQADLFAMCSRFGEHIADFYACNFGDPRPSCNSKEDEGVAFGESARRLCDAQQMTKFGGVSTLARLGSTFPVSEYARKSRLLRAKKR